MSRCTLEMGMGMHANDSEHNASLPLAVSIVKLGKADQTTNRTSP